jgi:hypothetical protein
LTAAHELAVNDTSKQDEIEKLRIENAKLNYRILHLTRALSGEDATPAKH